MKENKHIYERQEGSGHHDFFYVSRRSERPGGSGEPAESAAELPDRDQPELYTTAQAQPGTAGESEHGGLRQPANGPVLYR